MFSKHLAGNMGEECKRVVGNMGEEELERLRLPSAEEEEEEEEGNRRLIGEQGGRRSRVEDNKEEDKGGNLRGIETPKKLHLGLSKSLEVSFFCSIFCFSLLSHV